MGIAMVAVFISYARPDRDFANRIADQLIKAGHSVWWDWNLIGGEQFRSTIAQKLDEADKVIVLWTEHSTSSAFVVDEATRAREAGKLVPVSVSRSKPPLGFGDLHTIDFINEKISIQEISAALEGRIYTAFNQNSGSRIKPPIFYIVLGATISIVAITLLAFNSLRNSKNASHIPMNPQAAPSFSCDKYAMSFEEERTPQDDILCYDKEAADADQNMGNLYWILMRRLSAYDAERLLHQQLEWIKQRNQNCPAHEDDLRTPDGKVKQMLLAQKAHCLKLEFEKRYAELQKQANLIGGGDKAQSSKNSIDLSALSRAEP